VKIRQADTFPIFVEPCLADLRLMEQYEVTRLKANEYKDKRMMSPKHIAATLGMVLALGVAAQVQAGKTVEVVCSDGKTVQIDKMKNTPIAQVRLCKKAGHPAPADKPTLPKPGPQTLKKPGGGESKAALLLPAVQAAREAARRSKPQAIQPHGIKKGFGQRGGH
jgi:hypothetical protein